MDLVAVERTAKRLMTQHGLISKGWVFGFDRATSRLGATHFRTKKITLSRHMAAVANEAKVVEVILHEIAHALLPPSAKHGADWKALAKAFGIPAKASTTNPYIQATASSSKVVRGVKVGDRLRLPNREVLTVYKIARTRCHAVSETTGKRYAVPFAYASQLRIRTSTPKT
jgi:predicted SprT family Zn-dependent metalloprotease